MLKVWNYTSFLFSQLISRLTKNKLRWNAALLLDLIQPPTAREDDEDYANKIKILIQRVGNHLSLEQNASHYAATYIYRQDSWQADDLQLDEFTKGRSLFINTCLCYRKMLICQIFFHHYSNCVIKIQTWLFTLHNRTAPCQVCYFFPGLYFILLCHLC